MNFPPYPAILLLAISSSFVLPGCQKAEGHVEESHAEHHDEHQAHKIIVTNPVVKDVVSSEQYVCQIHSRKHIEIRALEEGYLEEIKVQEGQAVKEGELMFKLQPVLYQARLDSDLAEARLAKIKVDNTRRLVKENVVSDQELALAEAELAKVEAKVELAQAERDFADIKAPFDGIVDRQHSQQGSLIEEGEVLTTLSDNDVMWAYFNVREARYLDYKSQMGQDEGDLQIELVLANGKTFPNAGEIGAIEADFNNETGNIAFRADFPNPDGLLRHGQTGTVFLHRTLHNALVIPQRAKFEILAKQYVYVIDEDDVVRQREIEVSKVLEDIYVIEKGLSENDRIIFEGIRQVRDGDKVEFEFRDPTEILANLKNHAE